MVILKMFLSAMPRNLFSSNGHQKSLKNLSQGDNMIMSLCQEYANTLTELLIVYK